MKIKKIFLVCLILLAILSVGAVSANGDIASADDLSIQSDDALSAVDEWDDSDDWYDDSRSRRVLFHDTQQVGARLHLRIVHSCLECAWNGRHPRKGIGGRDGHQCYIAAARLASYRQRIRGQDSLHCHDTRSHDRPVG